MRYGFCVFLLLVPLFSWAQDAKDIEAAFRKEMKKFNVSESSVGLFVTSGEGGQIKELVSVRPDVLLIPASITKICTAAATLEKFPPGFKFKTQLLSPGKIQNSIL